MHRKRALSMIFALIALSLCRETPAQNRTRLECLPVQAAMMKKFAEFAKASPNQFHGSSPGQSELIRNILLPGITDLDIFPEIKAAAGGVAEINQYMHDQGFNIHVTDTKNPKEIAAAAVLKNSLSWNREGEAAELIAWNGRTYPAARIEKAEGETFGYEKREGLMLDARSGEWEEKVCMLELADGETERYSPTQLARLVMAKKSEPRIVRDMTALFPMVSVDKTDELKDLEGIYNDRYILKEAMAETRIDMDNKGARVEAAAIGRMIPRSVARPAREVIIKKPFLLFILRDKANGSPAKTPLISGYFYPDSWKRPAPR